MNNNLLQKHAKSFYWASFFLTKETFKKCSALYNFCRTLDDIADDTDQLEIKRDIIGEEGRMLTENLEVSVSFYNDSPISVELPKQINCKIASTDAALKGQTVSSSYKPATLDNGLSIQVPPFIEVGDQIILDTRNLEYLKKI